MFTKICPSHFSYDTSSRRKQPDRSKRSHHRRSPTSSRHGHRQRHREDREERSQSTSRRRHRDRVAKDRSPVKVKTNQYFLYNFSLVYSIFFFLKNIKSREKKKLKLTTFKKNIVHPNWTNYSEIFHFLTSRMNFRENFTVLFINCNCESWACSRYYCCQIFFFLKKHLVFEWIIHA